MAEAFDTIVREYQHRIFRLAYAILGERPAAEEVSQDVLLRVWKGLPGFRAESSISTWIYSITRNACLTVLKRRSDPPISLDSPEALRAVDKRAGADWATKETWKAQELLRRVPAKYRTVVALFYMQEKSYDEVSEMLGLPVGTVKTYLFRARVILAKALAHDRVGRGRA